MGNDQRWPERGWAFARTSGLVVAPLLAWQARVGRHVIISRYQLMLSPGLLNTFALTGVSERPLADMSWFRAGLNAADPGFFPGGEGPCLTFRVTLTCCQGWNSPHPLNRERCFGKLGHYPVGETAMHSSPRRVNPRQGSDCRVLWYRELATERRRQQPGIPRDVNLL